MAEIKDGDTFTITSKNDLRKLFKRIDAEQKGDTYQAAEIKSEREKTVAPTAKDKKEALADILYGQNAQGRESINFV
jgi:hypothetical protein